MLSTPLLSYEYVSFRLCILKIFINFDDTESLDECNRLMCQDID